MERQAANKKIINATPTTELGVAFKSKLEASIYKELVKQGFNPQYEPYKFIVWKGFKAECPFYKRNTRLKYLCLNDKKIIGISYTPDIVFKHNNYTVYMEVKPDNFTNDVYPYKEKLFRKYMETNLKDKNPIFVRIGTKKNLLEFIKILKEKYNEKS